MLTPCLGATAHVNDLPPGFKREVVLPGCVWSTLRCDLAVYRWSHSPQIFADPTPMWTRPQQDYLRGQLKTNHQHLTGTQGQWPTPIPTQR